MSITRLMIRIYWTAIVSVGFQLSWVAPSVGQEIVTPDGQTLIVPKWETLKPQTATLPEQFADAKFKTVDLSPFGLPGTIDILESMEVVIDGPFDDAVAIKYRDEDSTLANLDLGGIDFSKNLQRVHAELQYEINRPKDVFDAVIDYENVQFDRYANPPACFVSMTINGQRRYQGCVTESAGDYDYCLRFNQFNGKHLSRRDALLLLHIAGTIGQNREPKLSTVKYLESLGTEFHQVETARDIRVLSSETMKRLPPRRYDIFADLVNLESVYASRSPLVDDRLLAAIKNTTSLKQLHLDSCRISDGGMPNLNALENLWNLSLTFTDISDKGLENIGSLKSLRNLDLRGTPITGTGIIHLASFSEMKHLNLDETQVTDQGLAPLRHLSSLESLSLLGTPIRGEVLNDLRPLRELTMLDLRRASALDPHKMNALSTLPQLRRLYVEDTQVTPRFLQNVSGHSLESLYLDGTPTSDDDLKYLAHFQQLKRLSLDRCEQLKGETLDQLAQLKQLETVNLPLSISPANWLNLRKVPQLKHVSIASEFSDGDPFTQMKPELKTKLEIKKRYLFQLREAMPNCEFHYTYPNE